MTECGICEVKVIGHILNASYFLDVLNNVTLDFFDIELAALHRGTPISGNRYE